MILKILETSKNKIKQNKSNELESLQYLYKLNHIFYIILNHG